MTATAATTDGTTPAAAPVDGAGVDPPPVDETAVAGGLTAPPVEDPAGPAETDDWATAETDDWATAETDDWATAETDDWATAETDDWGTAGAADDETGVLAAAGAVPWGQSAAVQMELSPAFFPYVVNRVPAAVTSVALTA